MVSSMTCNSQPARSPDMPPNVLKMTATHRKYAATPHPTTMAPGTGERRMHPAAAAISHRAHTALTAARLPEFLKVEASPSFAERKLMMERALKALAEAVGRCAE